ncbi:hypothetical protein NLJ89_g5944 [Agrocybe chaxingu]|uniref:Uncharacterized protein n=1 Tax=Agrocybe chaxingu TaxID=84603 RepID=A0A9W8MWH4_9AGAR|nr:hypothetical protein NLJ89_g5944 [Agrocybe chaxingu]
MAPGGPLTRWLWMMIQWCKNWERELNGFSLWKNLSTTQSLRLSGIQQKFTQLVSSMRQIFIADFITGLEVLFSPNNALPSQWHWGCVTHGESVQHFWFPNLSKICAIEASDLDDGNSEMSKTIEHFWAVYYRTKRLPVERFAKNEQLGWNEHYRIICNIVKWAHDTRTVLSNVSLQPGNSEVSDRAQLLLHKLTAM